MSTLRYIGNSQGILIPKPLIKKANLEGHELEFELCDEGLLVKPVKSPRATWAAKIDAQLKAHEHDIDQEWLDADLQTWEEEDD